MCDIVGDRGRHAITTWRIDWSSLVVAMSTCSRIVVVLGMRVGEAVVRGLIL